MWLLPVVTWHYLEFGGVRQQASNTCETEFANNVIFKVSTAIMNFYLPSIAMVYLYSKIFREIQERTKTEIGQCHFGRPAKSSKNYDNDSSPLPPMTRHTSLRKKLSLDTSLKSNDELYHHGSVKSCHSFGPSASSQAREFESLALLTFKKNNKESTLETCETGNDQLYEGIKVSVEYIDDNNTNLSNSTAASATDIETSSFNIRPESLHPSPTKPKNKFRNQIKKDTDTAVYHKNHLQCYHSNHTYAQERTKLNGTPDLKTDTLNVSMSPYKRSSKPYSFIRRPKGNKASKSSEDGTLVRERKAARQLGVIMGAFIACWLPYFIMFMVIAYCGQCVNPHAHTAAIWLGYINSTLNPIIYPMCNDNFKRAFKKMLGYKEEKNSFISTSRQTQRLNIHVPAK